MKFKSEKKHLIHLDKIQEKLKGSNSKITLASSKPSNTLRYGYYKKKTQKIDFSKMNKIIEIDEENLWVKAEPKVTIYELTKQTLKKGLIPLVVPEFTSITVGGAIMGAALESSSHRYGQFNDTCLEYGLLLGHGELIKASPQENSDLFYAVSGSYGTLALLTHAKISLRKALPYVQLTYHRYKNVGDFFSHMGKNNLADFLEGVALSKENYVVIEGTMVDKPYAPKKRYWSKWYYQQIIDSKDHEVMRIEDYLFRFDRGAFWMGRGLTFIQVLQMLLRMNYKPIEKKIKGDLPLERALSLPLRLAFGWSFSSKNLYRLLHKTPQKTIENRCFIHDFYVPAIKVKEVFEEFRQITNIHPVWVCPLKGTHTPQFLSPHYKGDHFVNLGFYGIAGKDLNSPAASHLLEKKIISYGGRKMLYSFSYYSKEEFSKIYHQTQYEEMRKKYGANRSFPTLYEKVCS